MPLQDMNNALKILKEGGIILYPTDTVWGIGCDATNFEAVQKIYTLKNRAESKSMICLMSGVDMLKQYVETIPNAAFDIITLTVKPTTIVYDNPMNIAKNLIATDSTLAIRVVNEGFCHELIKTLDSPLVSTSANISNQPTPSSFQEISDVILKGVDYVVNLPNLGNNAKPSSIIKLSQDGKVKIIRA